MNRSQRRAIARPWRFTVRVKVARAIHRAKMPKDYHEKARALTEAKRRAFRALLGVDEPFEATD